MPGQCDRRTSTRRRHVWPFLGTAWMLLIAPLQSSYAVLSTAPHLRDRRVMRAVLRATLLSALACSARVAPAQSPCGATNIETVRAQISAYNRKDLDAFVRCYADSVRVFLPGRDEAVVWNRTTLRATYEGIFRNMPTARIEQRASVDSADVVTSEEWIKEDGKPSGGGMTRYRLAGGHITTTWIGLQLQPLSEPKAHAPPRLPMEVPWRALSDRSLDNLVAFSRLVSVVRFFHPTDSVLATNWDRFTEEGLLRVEDAASPEMLATILRDLFAGMAPTVQVYPAEHPLAPVAAPRPGPSDQAAVVFWEHLGVALPRPPFNNPTGNTYGSTLRIVAAPAWKRPADAPEPDSAYVISLEHGVTARVPLALWGVLPTDMASRSRTPRFPWRALFAARTDRAMQLAGVAEIWGVMQHFYPYHDTARTDWPAALRVALRTAATDSTPALFALTLNRLVAALHDGHGRVLDPFERRYAWLPVVFAVVEEKLTVVHASAPAAAGVKAGDIVISYNGRPASDVLAERMAGTSAATRQWAEWRVSGDLAQVTRNDTVTLEVRQGAAARTTTRRVRLAARITAPGDASEKEPRPPSMSAVRPGVLYVDLNTLTDSAFNLHFGLMQQAKAIIFDMRGYPNMMTPRLLAHLTDSTVYSAHFEKPIFRRPDGAGVTYADFPWMIRPIAPRLQGRIVFIVDGRAISYAESTMGVVEHYRLGDIVGEPTAGTNGNINPFVIPGGYQIFWTGMRVRKQDGSPHHGVGIQPTVLVHRTLKGVCEGRDELLERAIEVAERGNR